MTKRFSLVEQKYEKTLVTIIYFNPMGTRSCAAPFSNVFISPAGEKPTDVFVLTADFSTPMKFKTYFRKPVF
ncbi:MAG: hypothetical protein V4660_05560 [Pseudomonadota bacterium]